MMDPSDMRHCQRLLANEMCLWFFLEGEVGKGHENGLTSCSPSYISPVE